MRKKLFSLIACALALAVCFSSLSGCGLITVDTERDMKQVVATVRIEENAPTDTIYKRDMVMAYFNYGYMYEQYYGYTREQVFNLIINNLVQTRVYVQAAISDFEAGTYQITLDQAKEKWDVERYLDDEEKTDAKYTAYHDINELIESYATEDDEDKKGDTNTSESRTAPTGAANDEKELTLEEKKDYIAKGIDTESTDALRKAFNRVIDVLDANELVGDDYDGDVTTTEYFKQTLKNYQENKIVEKYENLIKKSVRDTIEFSDLEDAYAETKEEQAEWTNEDFVSALSSASASSPILVSKYGEYGFVYNLLLGVSEDQTALINALSKDLTKEERAEQRKVILKATKVKDLRSPWLYSGYDFDTETNKFTGDYAIAGEDSLPFQGTVTLLNGEDKEKDGEHFTPEYGVSDLREYKLDEFVDFMEEYLYGEKQTDANTEPSPSVYKMVEKTGGVDKYAEKINELLFTFSTDGGSLNTYKGYVIKPVPDGGAQEEYMQEFADYGRKLLTMGNNSYIMVATDYGYHIMFYSQVFSANFGYDTLTEYLDAEYGSKDWNAEFTNMMDNWDDYENDDQYLYLLCNSLFASKIDAAVTDRQNEISNKYIYSEDTCGVVWHREVYADLLG